MALMSPITADLAPEEDAILRRCLRESVGADVISLQRRWLDSSTSYTTGILTAELADGQKLKVFLKDFGHTVRPKDELHLRRQREIRFYRDLAPRNGVLGTPRYYGSVSDSAGDRHWLLLEFVCGVPVRHCEFPEWVPAAGWLGRMHGYFWKNCAQQMKDADFLERQNEKFFHLKAEQALRAVTNFSPELGKRLQQALADYDSSIAAMVRPPHTLLHGGYHALNVLTHIEGDPSRMCAIDWEEAGYGAALSDLSYFVNGFETERLDQLLNAYWEAAKPYGLPLPDRGEAIHTMNCFRLHKVLQSLPKYAAWDKPVSSLPKLVGVVERYAQAVDVVHAMKREANAALVRHISRATGRALEVTKVEREACPFGTLFPVERVTLCLTDGNTLPVFVKHLGEEQSDHPDKQRRDRESLVYERLLNSPGLPAPAYHGNIPNASTGRTELVLEYVDDWNLKYHELEQWYTAARRLAELHKHFASQADLLEGSTFLLRMDETYLNDWAGRAIEVVESISAELASQLRGSMKDYGAVTHLLTRQPPTLVHNDLSPKNVIADRSTTPARICFVDWEMAGSGCGLLDLVHLKYGLPPDADRKMVEAYQQALAGTGLIPDDAAELSLLLAACDAHKALYRLAHCGPWQLPLERVAGWAQEVVICIQRVNGKRVGGGVK